MGSQPSSPVVLLMSPEASECPLVPVAHLFFCDFSHPYSSLKDESIEFPFVQPMLAKGLGVGRGRAIGHCLNCGTLSCPHRSTCGSWVWHFLVPTFMAWGPEPVHFRAVPLCHSCLVHVCCLSEFSLGSPTLHPSKSHAFIKLCSGLASVTAAALGKFAV